MDIPTLDSINNDMVVRGAHHSNLDRPRGVRDKMKYVPVFLILILAIILIAWRYTGKEELAIASVDTSAITMNNGSEWLVYELDWVRAREWGAGQRVKLIHAPGFFCFDYLAININLLDAVHVKCVGDGQ